jgi:hypothetical protein
MWSVVSLHVRQVTTIELHRRILPRHWGLERNMREKNSVDSQNEICGGADALVRPGGGRILDAVVALLPRTRASGAPQSPGLHCVRTPRIFISVIGTGFFALTLLHDGFIVCGNLGCSPLGL